MPLAHIAPKATGHKIIHFAVAALSLWHYMIQCWRPTERFKTIGAVIIKVQQYLITKSSLCVTFAYKLGAINVLDHAVATDFLNGSHDHQYELLHQAS